MLSARSVRKVKSTLLVAVTMAGGTVFASSCGVTDIRHNLVAGAMSFVQDYTADMFTALVPPAQELVGGG